LLRGMDRMAGLVRPTLGPLPRTVAIGRLVGSGPPEVLDSAAIIARRTLQLEDPFEDMGAMIVRHLAWQVHERVGDGAATAAVLAQALVRAGYRQVAAGGNPVALKRGLERGLAAAVAELRRGARAIELPAEIAGVVAGSLGRSDLAEVVGEVVESVGPDGAVLVEDSESTETVHEYVDGVRWNEGYVSPYLLGRDETAASRLLNPRILVTDYALERAEQLLPALEACVRAGERSLFVVAPEVRDAAVGLLVVNRERGVLDGALAVRAPSFGAQRAGILDDIAVMTGGRAVRQDRGERLADVTLDHLGQARQAWAARSAFGILGGRGSKAAIRARIAEVRAELGTVDDDPHVRDKIMERIGKLAGTAAIIRVGAPTEGEREELKLRVQAAVRTARAALREGVVAGGGAALLACRPALDAVEAAGDEAAGVRLLAHALAEPMRAIAHNAGLPAEPIVHEAARRIAAPGCAFDVVRRAWVDPWDAGLVDALVVTQTALETSVSAAATALIAEVLVRRPQPPLALTP
jgi:chaperonin GroEL